MATMTADDKPKPEEAKQQPPPEKPKVTVEQAKAMKAARKP